MKKLHCLFLILAIMMLQAGINSASAWDLFKKIGAIKVVCPKCNNTSKVHKCDNCGAVDKFYKSTGGFATCNECDVTDGPWRCRPDGTAIRKFTIE